MLLHSVQHQRCNVEGGRWRRWCSNLCWRAKSKQPKRRITNGVLWQRSCIYFTLFCKGDRRQGEWRLTTKTKWYFVWCVHKSGGSSPSEQWKQQSSSPLTGITCVWSYFHLLCLEFLQTNRSAFINERFLAIRIQEVVITTQMTTSIMFSFSCTLPLSLSPWLCLFLPAVAFKWTAMTQKSLSLLFDRNDQTMIIRRQVSHIINDLCQRIKECIFVLDSRKCNKTLGFFR